MPWEPRFRIEICGVDAVEAVGARLRPDWWLTLLDQGDAVPDLPDVLLERRLRLDISDTLQGPTEEHARAVIAFGRSVPDGSALLVNCLAGISRSTAAALIILADMAGAANIRAAARHVRVLNPMAHPNASLVAHGDRLLGLGGVLERQALRMRQQADDAQFSRLMSGYAAIAARRP